MSPHLFDIAHMLAGGLVLLSLTMLYQDRMFGLRPVGFRLAANRRKSIT